MNRGPDKFKVKGKSFNRNLRGNIFTHGGGWNELPEEVVEAGTIPTFKKQLDRNMHRAGLEGYGPNTGSSVD